jgi:hypothetical protein
VDRKLDLSARRRRPFRNQLRRDVLRVGERGGEEQRKKGEQPSKHRAPPSVMLNLFQHPFR